jgi:hypothetical protein
LEDKIMGEDPQISITDQRYFCTNKV